MQPRTAAPRDHGAELRQRMRAPQRHRLLQGFPMAPLMRPVKVAPEPDTATPTAPDKKLIVGVLPHPFCNPRVEGCGFCTFPHERFVRSQAAEVAAALKAEIDDAVQRFGTILSRPVQALYFGGGTANLTPEDVFDDLCAHLAERLELEGAEVTLEGVPRYFLTHDEALLARLGDMPARTRRISMGVQTFDPRQLERMGRLAFGDREVIASAVAAAHRRGMSASADLLFNLPGQGRSEAVRDVRIAADIGFDQICVYNLVLFRGLGTAWSKDDELLALLPSRKRAVQTWLAVRKTLRELGYVQTTLTNFEREDVHESDRRFTYESLSFRPDRVDGWGFGPAGITTTSSRRAARKWMNATGATAYRESIERAGGAVAWNKGFRYAHRDRQLLTITRTLATTSMSLRMFERACGVPFRDAFAEPLDAIVDAGLVTLSERRIRFTPRGMFYADAVLGLLASERSAQLRGQAMVPLIEDTAAHHHMG